MTLLEAIADANLFKPWFKDPVSWRAWLAFLKTLFALPLDAEELATMRAITGRRRLPSGPCSEAWLVVGRRGGKSFIVSLIAVYLAAFKDWRPYLQPGEMATVMVIAADRKQARVILGYIKGLLTNVPMLAKLIRRETAEAIELADRVAIEVHTASHRSTRGYTVVAALLDELAFWRSEDSAYPDAEVINAIRPAMATIPGAMLLGVSSPYRRAGALWDAYQRHYGRDDSEVLVVQADSRTMNPSLPKAFVEREYARDPVAAAAEYGAAFRSDVSGFLDPAWISAAARETASDLPPADGVGYRAFVDPSGGRNDAFTLAIAHRAGNRHVVDLVRARRPPFSPEAVVADFAEIAKRFGCHRVTGDRYAGEWVSQAFDKQGLRYEAAAKSKSEIYLEAEPLFAEGSAEVPGKGSLLAELRQLERRTARGGRDSVDHPPRGHDDLANAACGALWLVHAKSSFFCLGSVSDFREPERRPRHSEGAIAYTGSGVPAGL